MILVTGATGSAGHAVADSLRKMNTPFRAMVRSNPKDGEVAADFRDRASLKAALNGIDTVFLVCSPVPDLVELESNVIDACVEAGVKHVVQLSALGAGDLEKSFPAWHRRVEKKLEASRLGYTILRPNGFFQNIQSFYAPTVRTQGAFYASMGDAEVSFLDVRDVGASAARILADPASNAGKIYELFGPESMTYAEIANRISQVAGKAAKYVDIPVEALRQNMLDVGMPLWQVDALMYLQDYYVSGQASAVTDTLPKLLGRPAITLNEFLSENKASFV
jgi:uncharacterized protein YbjT (DUF2867 family)